MRGAPIGLAARSVFLAALLASWAVAAPHVCRAQSSSPQGSSAQDQASPSDSGQAKDDASSHKDEKATPHGMTRIRINVTSNTGKPIENASVYVRFNQESGFLHKEEKLQELDLKTNLDGSVKVPDVPQGKILIQIVAKGWKTFGQWYEIDTDEKTIEIKLGPPPHWY
jgi:hypothetical protein